MSDILNIQPNAGQTPNEDTTFELEGYEDHINHLDKEYPDEEPVVPKAGEEFEPLAEPESKQQPSQPTSTDTQQQTTTETQQPVQQEQQVQPETEEFQGNKLFERGIARQNQYWEVDEETGDLKIDSIRDGEGRRLIDLPNGEMMIHLNSLTKVKHEKEDQLMEL